MAEEKINPVTKEIIKVLPLSRPIPIYNDKGTQIGQVHQVEIERLKVKHLKNIPLSFLDDTIPMTPSDYRQTMVAVLPYDEATVDEIDLVDMKEIVKVLTESLE